MPALPRADRLSNVPLAPNPRTVFANTALTKTAFTKTVILQTKYLRPAILLTVILSLSVLRPFNVADAADIPWDAAQTLDASALDLSVLLAIDLDSDGLDDLVGAGPGGLSWWPSAEAQISIDATTTDLNAIVAADLDRDGDLDILAASPTTGITWWQNTVGDGSSWISAAISAGLMARDVATADLDGDGDLDVIGALGGASGSIEWWNNTLGDGSNWSRSAIDAAFPHASSIVSADLDRDGNLDVVATADGTGDRVAWWESTAGDGSTWMEHTLSTALSDPHGITAADLNRDGFLDLVGADTTGLTWWLSDGSPENGWSSGDLAASAPSRPVIFDLNLDGAPDLITAAGDDVLWWEGTGDGSTWTLHSGPTAGSIQAVAVLHLDGDGDPDLAAGAHDNDDLLAWSNDSLHRSTSLDREIPLDSTFDGARNVHAADLDGDGDLDVVGVAFNEGEVAWWEHTGSDPIVWVRHSIETGLPYAFAVRTADLDNDGDLDVIGAFSRLNNSLRTDRLYWWRNDPAAESGSVNWTRNTVATVGGASDVWPVDMDRDGDIDLLSAAAAGSDEIAWYANNGSGGGWTETVIDTSFGRVHSVVGADIDQDGDTDIVAAADTGDEVAWWENTAGDGSLPFIKHSIITNWDGAYDAWAADLDGDGDLDVLAASQFEDRISWWENTDGEGSFGSENTLGDPFLGAEGFFNQAYSVETVDMNGDGTLDIVGAAFKDGGQVAWWSNVLGDATEWQKHDITKTYDGAGTVHIADVNGDGLPDLLTTAQTDDQLTYWPNGGGQFALATTSIAPVEASPSSSHSLFDIELSHRGQTGERDIELSAVEMRLQDEQGTALTHIEANAVIERLRVWHDDATTGIPGTLDGLDTEIAVLEALDLDAEGRFGISIPDGASEAAVAVDHPERFFITMDTTADSDQQGIVGLRITHLTSSSSSAEDRDHDIPLRLEFSPDTDTGLIALADAADLQLALESSADPITAGTSLTWTATVTNLGPDSAQATTLSFNLPSGVTLTATDGCAEDPAGAATCTLGNLALSAQAQVTVTVTVDSNASGTVELAAGVSSMAADPESANSQATSEVAVTAVSDLDLRIYSPAVYTAGAAMSYRVIVSGQGPGPANAAVSSSLPTGLTSGSWDCQAFGGASCGSSTGVGALEDTPFLPQSGSVEYLITADVDGGISGPIQISAAVSSGAGTVDPESANNSGTSTSYNVANSLFVDGFESGDTNQW